MAVLLLHALLFERALRTALSLTDPFGELLATGLAATLALQVFVVTGGVTGLVPSPARPCPTSPREAPRSPRTGCSPRS